MLTMLITSDDLKRLAHAANLHYERLRRIEGNLPPSEQALVDKARKIEAFIGEVRVTP